ncbi:methyltransferase domain-containing protein [bacterium]|nr:methyltransferase domain-containing protein [bacterium]
MDTATDLQARVQSAYSQIAESTIDPPFPTGRTLAEDVGYPADLINSLPSVSVGTFCGVSNVSLFADIDAQSVVLDVGCGAGLDSVVAARRAAKVIGVDFSASMLRLAAQAVHEAGLDAKVTLLRCQAQQLPLVDASVDVAMVNGIFNLNPNRQQIFQELARVIRPGGNLFVAEIVLKETMLEEDLKNPTNWFT